jgi:SAM-dependent methyltransferase
MKASRDITPEEFHSVLSRFHADQGFDAAYLRHAERRGYETFRRLPAAADRGAKLLDVGGMNGLFAPVYLDLFGYGEVAVIGNDAPASGFVDVAHQGGVCRMQAATCDIEAEKWPFPDETFDTVVCTEVLEHLLFDPMFAASEMCRVLKPGGSVLVTVPNTCSDECLLWLVNDMQPCSLRFYNTRAVRTGRKDLDAVANMGHFHEYTRRDMECLLEAAGFGIEEIGSFSTHPLHMATFKTRLLLRFVRMLFPHARRLPGTNLYVRARKKAHCPLERNPNRYPEPLYRPIG